MSKCRYCGREYDGGGLWDEGFCCGRCSALAKKNKITGKTPKGFLYIFLFIIAFSMLYSMCNGDTHNDNKGNNPDVGTVSNKSEHQQTETINHEQQIEDNSQIIDSSETEELPNEIEEATFVEEISPSTQPDSVSSTPSTGNVEDGTEMSATE